MIYQNKGKRQPYSLTLFEILIEIERESEETYAIQSDKLEIYEKIGKDIYTDNNVI